jgi:hypothetical protein
MRRTWILNAPVPGQQKEYTADDITEVAERLCADSGLSLTDLAGISPEQLVVLDKHPSHCRVAGRPMMNWTTRKAIRDSNQELFRRLIATMRSQ